MYSNDKSKESEIDNYVVNELKRLGVKCSKEKRIKKMDKQKQNPFGVSLDLLELGDVILANGSVVEIPKIISEACNFILENVKTEGIFRKGGSTLRQKDIRRNLQNGLSLGKNHHVIDIANVLKYFFRELPQPLISRSMQEPLLRCLYIGENCEKAVVMVCLLMHPIVRNTLAFFMQFLYTVSANAQYNKMTTENLAIVLTPSLMPYTHMKSPRFNNHVKVIQILIRNSKSIGFVPESILRRIETTKRNMFKSIGDSEEVYRKNKRRSDLISGLRKIVGSVRGSIEHLDSNVDTNNFFPWHQSVIQKTACFNKSNKQPSTEVNSLILAKGETKKCRLSMGAAKEKKIMKKSAIEPPLTKRRWSFAVPEQSKQRLKQTELSSTVKCKNNNCQHPSSTLLLCNLRVGCKNTKSEYDAIEDRVTAIEKRLSHEIVKLNETFFANPSSELTWMGTKNFSNKYDEIAQETVEFLSGKNDQLAKHLGHKLKVRRSTDQKIFRSPSARKIGTIRRRSHDANGSRISRTKTWNVFPAYQNHNENLTSSDVKRCSLRKPNLRDSKTISSDRYNQDFITINPDKQITVQKKETKAEEKWTSGEIFFEHTNLVKRSIPQSSDFKQLNFDTDYFLTPKRLGNGNANANGCSTLPIKIKKICLYTPNFNSTPISNALENSARPSIARLRAQNAGSVLAKAKLFDGLEKRICNEDVKRMFEKEYHENVFNNKKS